MRSTFNSVFKDASHKTP